MSLIFIFIIVLLFFCQLYHVDCCISQLRWRLSKLPHHIGVLCALFPISFTACGVLRLASASAVLPFFPFSFAPFSPLKSLPPLPAPTCHNPHYSFWLRV